jgi:hypothetical protein
MHADASLLPRVWPNATNTGVPAGTVLKSSGSITVSVAGTVISGLDIKGCIDIKANNVVVEKSRVSCGRSTMAIRVYSGFGGLMVRDSEIDGLNQSPGCIGYGGYTLLRDNIHGCVDGIDGGGNVAIEYTYVHDLARLTGSHNDAFQTFGGAHNLVVGNTFQAYDAATNDPMNSAIQTGALNNALSDTLVEYNYFDGGNYTVNAGWSASNPYPISGYTFVGNRFGRDYRYGPVQGLGSSISFDSTNVWTDTGTPVH